MNSHSEHGTLVKCPLCCRNQNTEKDLIVCSECINEDLAVIRNSCVENDKVNDKARSDINGILQLSHRITKGSDLSLGNGDVIDIVAVKKLALQSLKLELINANIKIRNIDKTKDSMTSRIYKTNQDIVDVEQEISVIRDKLKTMESQMTSSFNDQIGKINDNINEFNNIKRVQIQRQILQFRFQQYNVFKEVIYTNKRSRRLLYGQPILTINQFFDYNSKLFILNGFIENLIKVQMNLTHLFPEIHLPYVEELQALLPTLDFYDLVQKKENFIINGGEIDTDSELEPQVEPVDVNDFSEERVVKLGGRIKLPLSSKTINNQLRRALFVDRREEEGPQKLEKPENQQPADVSTPTAPPTAPPPITGKKMVIVPHKILTKPFTKLTSKEYISFILVIVKIIINFKVFLNATFNSVPKPSGFISHTINHLNPYNNDDNHDNTYNFIKIIHQVMSLQEYFQWKLSQTTIPSPSNDLLSRKPSSKFDDPLTFSSKDTGLKTFYNLFKEPDRCNNSIPSPSLSPVQSPSPEHSHSHINNNFSDNSSTFKAIMQDVHHLMSDGISFSNQSKLLADWDVISKVSESHA